MATPRKRVPTNQELKVMDQCDRALAPLSDEAKTRVFAYLTSLHKPRSSEGSAPDASAPMTQNPRVDTDASPTPADGVRTRHPTPDNMMTRPSMNFGASSGGDQEDSELRFDLSPELGMTGANS